MLDVLGMEPGSELVYRALMQTSGSTTAALASDLALSAEAVDRAMASLLKAGLVQVVESGGFAVVPAAGATGDIGGSPAAGLTPLDRQVLALLLSGLTDQAVATELGISLRTVQRRVRRLEDLAGVRTRMQLGWYAARNGWA